MLTAHSYYTVFWAIVTFAFGAAVGSFLNVVILRLPAGESIVRPPSRCPNCGTDIRWYDNIPILSFFLLLGRCRDCGSRISFRYPLVELVVACLALGLFFRWGLTPALGVYFLFCCAMVVVFGIDLDHMIIPDVISLNCIPIGIIACIFGLIPDMNWQTSLIGTLAGGAVLYVPAALYEKIRGIEGLGGGDIKLLAMIGAFTGIHGVLFVLFFSSLIGSFAAFVGIAVKGNGAKTPIPFGPFLTSAAIAYVFIGSTIIDLFYSIHTRF